MDADDPSRYKLAERLSDKLDEMGKDLKSMIEQINDASTTLGKTSKTDDPVSHRSSRASLITQHHANAAIAFTNRQNTQLSPFLPTMDRPKCYGAASEGGRGAKVGSRNGNG